MNEPDLDEIRLAFEFASYQIARRRRGVHLDDRRIIQLELWPSDHRNQRAGRRERGAASLLSAAARTSKFQNGPPTSITLVTPLASQT